MFLGEALCTFTDEQMRQWSPYASQLSFAASSAVTGTTGVSPFQLEYGENPRIPFDLSVADAWSDGADGKASLAARKPHGFSGRPWMGVLADDPELVLLEVSLKKDDKLTAGCLRAVRKLKLRHATL